MLQKELEAVVISALPEPVTHQILPVLSQCMHDGQHFLVVYRIQPLVRKELPALKGYRVTSLHPYCANPLSQHIALQNKWLRKMWQCKHWVAAHNLLEPVKGSLRCIRPTKCPLPRQVCQGCSKL